MGGSTTRSDGWRLACFWSGRVIGIEQRFAELSDSRDPGRAVHQAVLEEGDQAGVDLQFWATQ